MSTLPERRYRARLLRPNSDTEELHYFSVDGNPYTALTSMGFMRERKKPEGLYLDFEDMLHVDIRAELRKVRGQHDDEYEDCPMYYHISLWDFYEAIGYDRKTKRWSNPHLRTLSNGEEI